MKYRKLVSRALILTIAIIFMTNCESSTEKIDFYLSTKNLNDFSITYGISCAEECIIKNGRLQCIVPANGILLVPHKYKELPIDYRFFTNSLTEESKSEIPINYHRVSDGQPIPGIRIQGSNGVTLENGEYLEGVAFKYLRSQKDETYGNIKHYEYIDEQIIIEIKKCLN